MKKFLKICLYTIALAVAVFMVGCKGNDLPVDDGKLKIVTTIFPEYDWVKQIAGDSNNLDITFLMKNGGDLHSYSPSAEDILKISSCDMLVYVGGESDKWIEEILENPANSNIKTINLMNVLGEKAKEEELVEGMEDDDHDDHDDHDDDDAELEYDEHVWLSLDNAQLFVKSITENLWNIQSKLRKIPFAAGCFRR